MISTVTTTTTTVTTVASTTMAAGLGLIATLVLIAGLITKELTGAWVSPTGKAGTITLPQAVDRNLNLVIVPLLLTFALIVVVKVLEVLH
ncbi:MAG TPA: hypothetical protein DCK87_04700 [Desulfotomaculum sp.]|nr:hypothetical protein [Desulfotomaculum sp.]